MAFSLIDETKGAVPITALSKNQFPAWLAKSAEHERNWLTSIGFTADPGKHALVPGEAGKLARVLVGLGDAANGGGTMWALAGLPEALPEGTYGLETVPDGADPPLLWSGQKAPTAAASSGSPVRLFWPAISQIRRPATSGPRSLRPRPCASPKPP